MTQERKPAETGAPWYKYGHVWLIISGPAIVVVAGIVTAWIAVRSADPVIDKDYYRDGLEINKTLAARDRSHVPALQGRNHAATPAQH